MKCILPLLALLLIFSESPVHSQPAFAKKIQFDSEILVQWNTIIQTSDGGFLAAGGSTKETKLTEIPSLIKFDSLGNVQWVRYASKNLLAFEISEVVQFSEKIFYAAGYIQTAFASGCFIMKFDEKGNVHWMKIHNGFPSARMPFSVLSDGSCMLGGVSTYLPFIIRVDAGGTLTWSLDFFLAQAKYSSSIIQRSDSSFIMIGSLTGFIQGTITLSMVKIDRDGNVLWHRVVPSSFKMEGYSICATADNGFAICGRINGTTLYAAKFDSLGVLLWSEEINTFGNVAIDQAIAETANGDLIISCSVGSGSIYVRLGEFGVVLNAKKYNTPGGLAFKSINSSRDGGIVFAGTTGDSLQAPGLALYKTDSLGNVCNVESSFYSTHPRGSILDTTALSTFTGDNASIDFQFDTTGTFTETDLCNISSVPATASQSNALSLSPNPIHQGESLTLYSDTIKPGIYDLRIFDLLGNCPYKEKIDLSNMKQDIPINVNTLPSGSYTIEIQNASGTSYHAKFVKE